MNPNNQTSLWRFLLDSPVAQRLIVGLRLYKVSNALLGVTPIYRKLKKMGLTYRVRKTETFLVADEMFFSKIYECIVTESTHTFLDIGSNTGFFPLYIADVVGCRNVRGLAVDADPEMYRETCWHLKRNGLSQVQAIHGLAGAPPELTEGAFFIGEANIASSVLPGLNPFFPQNSTCKMKETRVATVNLVKAWKERFGEERIKLLKIDIEGYERELICNSPELLQLVEHIAVEVHKWVVTPEEIEQLLRAHGFVKFSEAGESTHLVVLFFKRVY